MKNKVAILYIALGRYTVFWDEFYESAEQYLDNADKHYFVWTDNPTPAMRAKNVTIIPAVKQGWPFDSLLRFKMFSDNETALGKYDYIYFFNANMKFINHVDLTEIAPRPWNNGLVAGLHPGRSGDIFGDTPDNFLYERRKESTAYVPYGCGKHYVCGAFNGGTSAAFLKMCRVLAKNVQIDLDNDINAVVDDESHLNAYLHDKNFLLAGRAYGFAENEIKRIPRRQRVLIKIISRRKDHPKYGGAPYLRGQTERMGSPNVFVTGARRLLVRVVALFIPNKHYRNKFRKHFW